MQIPRGAQVMFVFCWANRGNMDVGEKADVVAQGAVPRDQSAMSRIPSGHGRSSAGTATKPYVDQHWMYNASLWWQPLVSEDTMFGPWLSNIAEELTALTHQIVHASYDSCFGPREACPQAGQCQRRELGALTASILAHFEKRRSGLLMDFQSVFSFAPELHAIVEGLDLTVSVAGENGCSAFTDLLLDESSGPCVSLSWELPMCAHAISSAARLTMAQLHDAQIAALSRIATAIGDERSHADRCLKSFVSSPRPESALFVGTFGLDRADMLVRLLQNLIKQRADNGQCNGAGCDLMAVEIGVETGDTSVALLGKLPQLRLLLVDPFEFAGGSYWAHHPSRSPETAAGKADALWNRLKPFRNRTIVAIQASADVAVWVANGSIDLVFIDGDHSYTGVQTDISSWRPKLRKDGILVGHDYALPSYGVRQAVHELAESVRIATPADSPTLHLGPDHMWWFQLR